MEYWRVKYKGPEDRRETTVYVRGRQPIARPMRSPDGVTSDVYSFEGCSRDGSPTHTIHVVSASFVRSIAPCRESLRYGRLHVVRVRMAGTEHEFVEGTGCCDLCR